MACDGGASLTVDLFTSYFPEINLLVFGALTTPDEVAVLHVAFRIAMLIGFGVHAIEAAKPQQRPSFTVKHG